MGSDTRTLMSSIGSDLFQSTLPVWGATFPLIPFTKPFEISIHAPRVGSDDVRDEVTNIKRISIHAPRVGSDLCGFAKFCKAKRYFNPRSPCGERLICRKLLSTAKNFNPRSPCGERPFLFPFRLSRPEISIHAPRVGSDFRCIDLVAPFNISIHAPRVGSDNRLSFAPEAKPISIHAPRVGSDCVIRSCALANVEFQSTLPVWGATAKTHKNMHAFLLSSTKYHINEYFVKIIIPENNSKSKYNL